MSGTITQGRATVHKFPLSLREVTRLPIAKSAAIIHCAVQYGEVVVWAIIPCDADGYSLPTTSERLVEIYGTGHSIPGGRKHVGTVMDMAGALVWHIFEVMGS